jgi:hypothetical protein
MYALKINVRSYVIVATLALGLQAKQRFAKV